MPAPGIHQGSVSISSNTMSHPRKAHTLEITERRLRDIESAIATDPMELIGLHDELARVERKWIEQTRAGSDRRRPGDKAKMDAYFDRLTRQIDAALRREDVSADERKLLDTARTQIDARPQRWESPPK
jgi:hypothetical protein